MWEEKVFWKVTWSETDIWGNDRNGSKEFDDEFSAKDFIVKLCIMDERVDYIKLDKSTVWRLNQRQ